MIRWFVDKDGNKKLQVVDPWITDLVSIQELVGGRFHRWKDIPIAHESFEGTAPPQKPTDDGLLK